MKSRILYLIAAMVISGAWSAEALACSCAGEAPPCQAFWRSEAVFAGTVVSSGKISVDLAGSKYDQRLVHLTVDQPIRGMQTAEVDVVTGWGGGDCGFGFKIGERYLVYAYRDEKDRFTLKIFEGLKYSISAYKESGALRAQSSYIEIPMNLGDEPLKLELPPLRPIR
jgi:hypothetical protein